MSKEPLTHYIVEMRMQEGEPWSQWSGYTELNEARWFLRELQRKGTTSHLRIVKATTTYEVVE